MFRRWDKMNFPPWFARRRARTVAPKPVVMARTEAEYYALFDKHSHIRVCDEAPYYDMGRLLASGAFGQVHACTDRETGATLAAKRSDANARYLVESEVSCLRMFPHANVVRIVDAFGMDGYLWVVLEWMEGGDLAQLLLGGRGFPQPMVAFVAKEVLQALSFLHDNGVVHRDIKPPNLLFNAQGDIKLADFGFASVLSRELPTRRTKHGTPGYRAPELIAGRAYGTKVDVWSLGVTLLELVQGRSQAWDVGSVLQAPYPKFDRPCSLLLDAKTFLCSMLLRKTEQRASAKDLLAHPFLQNSSCSPSQFVQFANRRKVQL